MSLHLKYIKTRNDEVIIFPATIDHSDMRSFNPVSAGFCSVKHDTKKVSCFGSSYSLNISSNPEEDSFLATRQVFRIEAAINLL